MPITPRQVRVWFVGDICFGAGMLRLCQACTSAETSCKNLSTKVSGSGADEAYLGMSRALLKWAVSPKTGIKK